MIFNVNLRTRPRSQNTPPPKVPTADIHAIAVGLGSEASRFGAEGFRLRVRALLSTVEALGLRRLLFLVKPW